MVDEREFVVKYLPIRISNVICKYFDRTKNVQVNEIRLRSERPLSLTVENKNTILDIVCTQQELNLCVDLLCEHSLHTYSDSIKNGYISVKDGYRVGICGKAITEDGIIVNVTNIGSVNIRIPHKISNVSNQLYDYLKKYNFQKGVLIYSPPGVGKTTLLRDIAVKLSDTETAKRVVIIDSRMELYNSDMMENSLIDLLSGYPKGIGIEIATRTMSPEILICDEIGSYEEAIAILSVQNSGVPLIATGHATTIDELLRRKNIKILHENHIFDCYIGIDRNNIEKNGQYEYTISEWEDVNFI